MGETLLDRILAPHGLTVAFQPILEFSVEGWRLHAFEGLVRGLRGTHIESSQVLFEYARRKGAERYVDRRCVAEVLRAAAPLGREANLSLNIHAASLGQDADFPRYLEQQLARHRRTPSRTTIEIVEHAPSWSRRSLAQAVNVLREIGVNIALDDVGLGQSNFRMILECRPDYFKIDRLLVQGSHTDYYRRAVLRSVAELASSLGGTAVAEGVDDPKDLQTVLGEGIRTVQGYLLSVPAAAAVLGHADVVSALVRQLPTTFEAGGGWMTECDWLSIASRRMSQGTPTPAQAE